MEAALENKEKFWRFWRAYCKPLGIDPYLEEFDFQTKKGLQQDFQAVCKKSAMVMEKIYKLEQCMHHSVVSTRRLTWKQGGNPSTNLDQTTNTSYRSNTCSKGLKKISTKNKEDSVAS